MKPPSPATRQRLLILAIGIGVLLRIGQYLANTSLSIDECSLALNIIHRSYAGLLLPLDYNQGAPVGFLLLQKFLVTAGNDGEYALRLAALLSGIMSLFLFHAVAKRFLPPDAVLTAVALFAIGDPLVSYSVQVKQYSSDVLLAVLLCWTADLFATKPLWLPRTIGTALLGATAVWFSHPAIFILAGIGIALFVDALARGEHARRNALVAIGVVWCASFLICYKFILSNLSHHAYLLRYWSDSFVPLPPRSADDVKWYIMAFLAMFKKVVGLSLPGIGGLTFVTGTYALWRTGRRRGAMLLLPVLCALAASALGLYPFAGRLILFTAPALILCIASGVAYICEHTRRAAPIVGYAMIVLLFLQPTMWAGYHLLRPRCEEDVKPVLQYLRDHKQANDTIYLYYGADGAFRYYAKRYGFDRTPYVMGVPRQDDWAAYQTDLARLRGRGRVWIVFSHIYNWEDVDERKLFLYFLDQMGTRIDSCPSQEAAVYLYDLR